MQKKVKITISLFICFCFLLTACGNKQNSVESTSDIVNIATDTTTDYSMTNSDSNLTSIINQTEINESDFTNPWDTSQNTSSNDLQNESWDSGLNNAWSDGQNDSSVDSWDFESTGSWVNDSSDSDYNNENNYDDWGYDPFFEQFSEYGSEVPAFMIEAKAALLDAYYELRDKDSTNVENRFMFNEGLKFESSSSIYNDIYSFCADHYLDIEIICNALYDAVASDYGVTDEWQSDLSYYDFDDYYSDPEIFYENEDTDSDDYEDYDYEDYDSDDYTDNDDYEDNNYDDSSEGETADVPEAFIDPYASLAGTWVLYPQVFEEYYEGELYRMVNPGLYIEFNSDGTYSLETVDESTYEFFDPSSFKFSDNCDNGSYSYSLEYDSPWTDGGCSLHLELDNGFYFTCGSYHGNLMLDFQHIEFGKFK